MTPGEALSSERLADALWSETPPTTWNKVVQGCVMRLRRLLGAEAIETLPQGYRLSIPADEVDAHRFERLLGRARELLALGEADRASFVADEA
jgi:DNA-binding SARP family transcriptional activator